MAVSCTGADNMGPKDDCYDAARSEQTMHAARREAYPQFGELVRTYRRTAGLTQEGLAEAAGLSVRAIRDIESGGKHAPRNETIRLLAEALDVPEEKQDGFVRAALACRPGGAPLNRLSTLPSLPTRFIGRARERTEVAHLLQQPAVRLLTLTGPGGIGKTRLAIQVATDVGAGFEDGIVFVQLASLSDPGLVTSALGEAVLDGYNVTGDNAASAIKEYVWGKHMLLVLDNFEHLLQAAPTAAELLEANPHLTVLATSRSPLRIYGEHEYQVPPLSMPARSTWRDREFDCSAESDAVRLFLERAHAVKPNLELTQESMADVNSICVRLDGLPLAIELAAARIRLFSPAALLRRLDRRLDLLAGGGRDLPERLQSVRAALDWSYDLLGEQEATLFAQLGVFPGNCSIEAIEAVCGLDGDRGLNVLDALTSLMEHSLLQQEEGVTEARFGMLETIREYALERLRETGQEQAVRRRHAEYYLHLVREMSDGGLQEVAAEERSNIGGALAWCRNSGEISLGVELALHLTRRVSKWYVAEWRQWLEALLAAAPDGVGLANDVHVEALCATATLARAGGDDRAASDLLEQAVAVARHGGSAAQLVTALAELGMTAHWKSPGERKAILEESLLYGEEHGSDQSVARALSVLAEVAAEEGDQERARMLRERSLCKLSEIDDPSVSLDILQWHFSAAMRTGDRGRARELAREALVVARQMGAEEFREFAQHLSWWTSLVGDNEAGRAVLTEVLQMEEQRGNRFAANRTRIWLAWNSGVRGDYGCMDELAEQALQECSAAGDKEGILLANLCLSDHARAIGDAARTEKLAATALRLAEERGNQGRRVAALHNLAMAARQRGEYDRARSFFDEALATSNRYAMPPQPVVVAEVYAGLGLTSLEQGERARAGALYAKALPAACVSSPLWLVTEILEGLASVAIRLDNPDRAARLFAVTETCRCDHQLPIRPFLRSLLEQHLAATRQAARASAWEEGRAMTLNQATAYALVGASQGAAGNPVTSEAVEG